MKYRLSFVPSIVLVTAVLLSTTLLIGNISAQSYWYCWDTGSPSPHHLGYHVYGDHYCSDAELGINNGPTLAQQGATNGANNANTTNHEYIIKSAANEGHTEGYANGQGLATDTATPDSATFCAKLVPFSTPQSQEYSDAFQSSYAATCAPIYNAAYSSEYALAYASAQQDKAAAAKSAGATQANKGSNAGWYIAGGIAALYGLGALVSNYSEDIKKWYEKWKDS